VRARHRWASAPVDAETVHQMSTESDTYVRSVKIITHVFMGVAGRIFYDL